MSFGNSGGGTLTLPSPTHPNHIDVQAAVRSLRRSISRSPSKFQLARTSSQSSDVSTSSTNSQNSSTPASPSLRRMASHQFPVGVTSPSQNAMFAQPHSPLATPFRPNVKLSLRSAKSSTRLASTTPFIGAPKSASRNRSSPKSPSKRALSPATSSAGNSAPSSSNESEILGQENSNLFRTTRSPTTRSPTTRKSSEKGKNRHSMHLDMTGASLQAMTRITESANPGSTASPLKRSDATMDLDPTSFGSPKAKRRSFGPSSFGNDFNVFDQGPASPPNFDIHDESNNREYDWTASGGSDKTFGESNAFSTQASMPRRANSLRKSTLQQRHTVERTSWGRRHGAHLSQGSNEISSPSSKNRPRLSMDHYLPPPTRESPFSAPGPLPNASVHPLNLQPQQPHPLSRTMTTSSSNSSLAEDSPTHFPIPHPERPNKAAMNWSKSLPIGAVRPTREDDLTQSVTTPTYKAVKPYSGAFASTGLVSKMNRYPEFEPVGRGGAPVPDTPCKNKVSGFATFPPAPGSNIKARSRIHRNTFGAPPPATPFNSSRSQGFNEQGQTKSNVLFSLDTKHARKGSILSLYSDDGARSPIDIHGDSQMTMDGDLPPTPTKQQLLTQKSKSGGLRHFANDSPSANRRIISSLPAIPTSSWQPDLGAACKFTPSNGSSDDHEPGIVMMPTIGISDVPVPTAPVANPSVSITLPSFGRTRAERGPCTTPSPLKTNTFASIELARTEFAKKIPASPLDRVEFAEGASPKTPQDSVAPPETSRLFIFNRHEGLLWPTNGGKKSAFPPATPTARQDSSSMFQDRRAITPTNGGAPHEVDSTLLSRFGKVDYIGAGEFSQVYRVANIPRPSAPAQTGFFSTPKHHTPPSPSPNQVFAVKKLKLPIKGASDRAFRLREVTALSALRGAEHVVQLVDSWETNNNLYIQTEYCEEGSLDVFLGSVGVKGRLDDFRIWKIFLELSRGLYAIHNAGFVHLDLKPANILINFEGTLKIGDFGMATALPADSGPDFEGDREYIAYEVLRGEIDKPADVFSLGLIMLEISANVELPENGVTWTCLRHDDFKEIPTLTQETDSILRDATGMPIDDSERNVGDSSSDESTSKFPRRSFGFRSTRQSNDIFGLGRKGELSTAPSFMRDPTDSNSLDIVVKSMLASAPSSRPTVSQLLNMQALHWISSRQRAGATVFEGNWGPADELLEPISLDTEMTDV